MKINNLIIMKKKRKKKFVQTLVGLLPKFYCKRSRLRGDCIAILGLYCNLGGWKVVG